ncbi:unnamed protein product [Discula destructiva]
MSSQLFHRFPELPREIRDEIWRHCLPSRVVELDLPNTDWYLLFDALACELWPTSYRNRLMPVVTRVCRESREIAVKTGKLHMVPYKTHLSPTSWEKRSFWVDQARDSLHLHWNSFLSEAADHAGKANIVQLFAKLSSGLHNASITADLLDSLKRETRLHVMRQLQTRPNWSVCGAVVAIHTTDKAAVIESGLWGSLAEETIVLVDVCDAKRIAAFRRFWQAHSIQPDAQTQAFFDACVDSIPKIHYVETPEEFLQDLEVRWLLDSFPLVSQVNVDLAQLSREVWLTTPDTFDNSEDDPRQADYGELPGRPFARQLWVPNRAHPWVRRTLSKMPNLQPTIMFRLCTGDCPSKVKKH